MYHNNIDFSLTCLGLCLITNIFGAPGGSSLAENHGEVENDLRSLMTYSIQ